MLWFSQSFVSSAWDPYPLRYWRRMLELFQAGLVAAALQLLTVVIVTAIVWPLSKKQVVEWLPGFVSFHSASPVMVFSFLAWAYVLTALGFAFTRGRVINVTAERIRAAALLVHPRDPTDVAKALFVQSLITAVVLVILGLAVPFESPANLIPGVGFGLLRALAWPAGLSVGVAGFGAIAHAARHAFR